MCSSRCVTALGSETAVKTSETPRAESVRPHGDQIVPDSFLRWEGMANAIKKRKTMLQTMMGVGPPRQHGVVSPTLLLESKSQHTVGRTAILNRLKLEQMRHRRTFHTRAQCVDKTDEV